MSHYSEKTGKCRACKSHGKLFAGLKVWLVAAILLSAPPAWAGGSKKRPANPAPADPNYVFALATANRFLHAWQTGDLETGMVLLTNEVRHAQDPEKLEQFFSSTNERAFEIARGQGSRGRYRFAVALITTQGKRLRWRSSEIIVIDTGRNDWAVDKLP